MQSCPLHFMSEMAGPGFGKHRIMRQGLLQIAPRDRLRDSRGLGAPVTMILLGIERGFGQNGPRQRALKDQRGPIILVPDEMEAAGMDDMNQPDGVTAMENGVPRAKFACLRGKPLQERNCWFGHDRYHVQRLGGMASVFHTRRPA